MTTRFFGGGLPYPSLIPVADLFNHSNSPTVYYYGDKADSPPDCLSFSDEDNDDNIIDESDCIDIQYSTLFSINF